MIVYLNRLKGLDRGDGMRTSMNFPLFQKGRPQYKPLLYQVGKFSFEREQVSIGEVPSLCYCPVVKLGNIGIDVKLFLDFTLLIITHVLKDYMVIGLS